jgi:hypothetical protein
MNGGLRVISLNATMSWGVLVAFRNHDEEAERFGGAVTEEVITDESRTVSIHEHLHLVVPACDLRVISTTIRSYLSPVNKNVRKNHRSHRYDHAC